jgi:hypothetical protein
MLISGSVLSQQDTTFTKEQVDSLKTIADHYSIAVLWISAAIAILVPVLSFFGLRSKIEKWAEDKAMAKIADKLSVKKEALEAAMTMMMREHTLKERKILIVSPTEGQPLSLTEFLKNEGFSNLDFIQLENLKNFTPAGIDLMLFNYLNQSLKENEAAFGNYLTKYKDNVRMLVLGSGQTQTDFKKELGNRLSFSNGFDTLSERILGAYKQPV